MNYYEKTNKFLSNALGSSLTSLQEIMVYINAYVAKDEYDIATFALENHLTPCMDIAKLANFGSLVGTYWHELMPEEITIFQNDPQSYYKALAKYEDKEKIELTYLERFGYDDEQIKNFSKTKSYNILKALKENRKLVQTNIQYLIDLEITNYKEIFERYYELFLMDNSNFVSIFNKYDQKDLASKLEKNVGILEYL